MCSWSPQIEFTWLLGRGKAKKKIPIKAEKLGVDMVVVGQRGLSKEVLSAAPLLCVDTSTSPAL